MRAHGGPSRGGVNRPLRRRLRVLVCCLVPLLWAVQTTAVVQAESMTGRGDARARIVGGTVTAPEAAPWAVALTDSSGAHFCGGALVSAREVVTAAHCTLDPTTGAARSATDIRVVLDRRDLRTRKGEVIAVERVWRHSRYEHFTRGDDVAVLTLRSGASAPPLKLVDAGERKRYRPGTTGTVYGWGRTAESEPTSQVLRSVRVPVMSNFRCSRAYPGFDRESMFCAGYPEGGKDACGGDSGGPFVVDGRLVGLVSYGSGCARPDFPGVYTRLSSYAARIRDLAR
ncbi:Trypsin [Actinopolyspora alba]|uniref:Trypsin n=1 Tax=Actinopolyspora alba TaxID=673379 RepID=A0A1I1V147_9ACTN|nr:serine protease [Actinopolyspora alba]SFD76746.1 Trypsin [Actinopolyspora alba]